MPSSFVTNILMQYPSPLLFQPWYGILISVVGIHRFMKNIQLLHNPAAGEGQYSKKDLLRIICSEGHECSYSSTKKEGWECLTNEQPDFIAVAGGDGTVRKLARELLNRKVLDPSI